jgi:hypothetical protein
VQLPRISPRLSELLNSTTGKELIAFGALGIFFFIAALFQPYSNERPYSHESAQEVAPDHLPLQERLGFAVLLHAGYVRVLSPAPDAGGDNEEAPLSDRLIRNELSELVSLSHSEAIADNETNGIKLDELTISIVAAEKYNRSFFERKLEIGVAKAILRLTGALPDFSIGPAQIRPSRARRLIHSELGAFNLSDQELFELLRDDEFNIWLAGLYIAGICEVNKGAGSVDAIIAKVVASYNGATTPTINGLRYVDAVTGAYHLLLSSSDGEDADATSPSATRVTVLFGLGSVAGTGEWDILGEKQDTSASNGTPAESEVEERKTAKAKIFLCTGDMEPKAFHERLNERRKQWLIGRLETIGYQMGNISVFTEKASGNNVSPCNDAINAAVIEVEAIKESEPAEVTPVVAKMKLTPKKTPEKAPRIQKANAGEPRAGHGTVTRQRKPPKQKK